MKIFYSIILAVLILADISAQTTSSYTRYGVGDPVYSYSSRRVGMGDLGVSVADFDYVSTINPASWNKINRTRLEFGGIYNRVFLSSGSGEDSFGDGAFTGFTFAFPASTLNGMGIALGLVPYSRVGYNVTSNVSAASTSYQIEYEGDGGLSKVFVGSSYRFPFGLSFGATFDYYFGNITYRSKAIFNTSGVFDSEYKKVISSRGIGTNLGIISSDLSQIFKSDNLTDFRIGAALNLISTLTADTILTGITALNTDTLGSGTVDMKLPITASFGASMLLNGKLLIHANYLYQPWSKYELNRLSSSNLRDAMKVSAGFEYRLAKETASFWEQIFWRAGLSYEQTKYTFNGEGINEYSVSAGFSFPISTENTLDFGAEYSMRGTSDFNLFKENILKLTFGVSLGEMWFIRQDK